MATVHERGIRGERGQALVASVVFLSALMAMAGASVDVGSWYWQDRKLQGTADAAALAGAQGLANGTAVSLAVQYGNANDGGVAAGDVTLSAPDAPTDTVTVQAHKIAPTYFTRLFGFTSVNVRATATARAGIPEKAKGLRRSPWTSSTRSSAGRAARASTSRPTSTSRRSGPGAFRLINLDGDHGGTGPSIVADWILNGYDGYMPLDWYFSDSGAKFNSSQVKNAMQMRVGDTMLFPIYTDTRAQGVELPVPRRRLGRLPRHRLHRPRQRAGRSSAGSSPCSGTGCSASRTTAPTTSASAASSSSASRATSLPACRATPLARQGQPLPGRQAGGGGRACGELDHRLRAARARRPPRRQRLCDPQDRRRRRRRRRRRSRTA